MKWETRDNIPQPLRRDRIVSPGSEFYLSADQMKDGRTWVYVSVSLGRHYDGPFEVARDRGAFEQLTRARDLLDKAIAEFNEAE